MLKQSTHLLFLAFFIGCITTLPLNAANRISDRSIQVETPLTPEEIAEIRDLEEWPMIPVKLRDVSQEVIESIRPLTDMKHLELSGRETALESFEILGAFEDLSVLKLRQLGDPNQSDFFYDVAPLANLTQLRELTIYATHVTGLDALAACTQLRELSLYMASADSLSFLEHTPHLTALDLYGKDHRFDSYALVAQLGDLRELNLYMNPLALDDNLQVLAGLSSLREIGLGHLDEITNLDFLANNLYLQELKASWTDKLVSIEALRPMLCLQLVDIRDSQVTDLSPLTGKPTIETINLSGTPVTDLSALKGLVSLEDLDVSETAIQDLSKLPFLPNLQSLNLEETPVTDLSPLVERTPRLQSINLREVEVTDFEPLFELLELEKIVLDRDADPALAERLRQRLPF